jgi:hypothetical protein
MLSASRLVLMRHGAKRKRDFQAKLKKNTKSSGIIPTNEFRKQNAENLARLRPANSRRYGELPSHKTIERDRYRNAQMALQMSGDANSLSHAANFGVSPSDVAAHGVTQLADRVTPPESYTPLMARKLTEGRLWPGAGIETTLPNVIEVPHLEPWDNLTPSEKAFSTQLEYLVRRNLNAAPAQLIEQMDMSEFILDRIAVWRRSHTAWFVWTTVSPEMRAKIEPYVVQLGPWLKRQIHRMPRKYHYMMPQFKFVYRPADAMPERISRATVKELESIHQRVNTSIDERVERLRAHDTVDARLRGVPWFMPYLWAKDKKLKVAKQSYEDLKVLEDRKNGGERKPENPGMPNTYKF